MLYVAGAMVFATCAIVAGCTSKSGVAEGVLSEKFYQLPDSIFSAKIEVDQFAATVGQLQNQWEIDTAYEQLFQAPNVVDDFKKVEAHFNAYLGLSKNSPSTSSWIEIQLGLMAPMMGKPDSAPVHFGRAIHFAKTCGNPTTHGKALGDLSHFEKNRGHLGPAIRLLNEARSVFEIGNDSVGAHIALIELAGLYLMQSVDDKAAVCFEEAHGFFRRTQLQNGREHLFCCTDGMAIFNGLQQPVRSLELGREALAVCEKLGREVDKFGIYNEAISSFLTLGRLDSAQMMAKKLDELGNLGDVPHETQLLGKFHKGALLARTGKAAAGQMLIAEGINEAEKLGATAMLLAGLKQDILVKKQVGDYRGALAALEKKSALQDSVGNQRVRAIVADQLNQSELAARERKIELLIAEKKVAGIKNGAFAAIGLLIAGMVGLFFFFKSKKEKAVVEAELAQNRLRLADFVELLAAKNVQIEALASGSDAPVLFEKNDAPAPDLPDEIEPSEADIEILYSQTILTEADWQHFKKLFETVHPRFLGRVRGQFPDLSQAELRLAMLIKMGMKTVEMAAILGISAESVRKTRYRLRRKMGLGEQKMEDVFAKI